MQNNRRIIDLTPEQNTLERVQGEELYKKTNLLAYWDSIPHGNFTESDNNLVHNWLSFLSKYGFQPISDFYLAAVYAYIAKMDNLIIPKQNKILLSSENQEHDKNLKKERVRFLDTLHKKFSLKATAASLSILLEDGTDIAEEIEEMCRNHPEDVSSFLDHRYVPNYINKQLKNFVQKSTGLIVFLSHSTIEHKYPTITFRLESEEKELPSSARMSDVVVTDESDVFNHTLALILEHNSLTILRDSLINGISSAEIKIIPAIQKEGWIEYPLMKLIKKHIKEIVGKNLSEEPLLCDPLDLEYQILFRLTSYELEEIFENGSVLKEILNLHTNQINWQGLVTLHVDTVKKFKLNDVLIQEVLIEQKKLIANRLAKSTLPLERILKPTGIFKEDGWVISKADNAYKLEHNEKSSIPITFKEVKKEVAQAFHNDLHYIHTPRIWKSYGFFMPDEELPFSVLAIEPVDRSYKRNTLLLFGHDPRHCIEFTRLYSWPGVPKNVSSAIFGAMFSYLRKYEPRVEAAISAFMPTYASGLSMLTGGFDYPILSKQGVHYFSPKNISGSMMMEHITNRRKESYTVSTSSKLPLLPTIELIAPMKRPRFEPFLQIGTHMIEI